MLLLIITQLPLGKAIISLHLQRNLLVRDWHFDRRMRMALE
jgi:hypothetical protein